MRWLSFFALIFMGLSACEEVDDNERCSDTTDCSEGHICIESYCKLRVGMACIRPSQCSTGHCSKGFCAEN